MSHGKKSMTASAKFTVPSLATNLAPKFAPLNIPMARRLQTASVVFWLVLYPLGIALFVALSSYENLFPFMLAYLIYMFLDPAPEMGGRKLMWMRRLPLWEAMRDYFPVSLVKTAELDPSKNYVFGYHPHGIIGLGAWINFATEANQFSSMFTGIDIHLLTLNTNFNMPFTRDLLLSLGICSVSRRSCDNILTAGPGSSLMIVVGGAQEASNAHPNTNDLVVKKRLGFIKLALRNGSPLVPVFSFGENDLWEQLPNPEGSFLRKFQDFSRKWTTVVPPFLHGRGIFQYSYGIVPFRKQVVSVVGNPIEVPKLANPTIDEVKHYQKLYLDELQRVYDTYKDKYLPNRTKELCFTE
ncbi:diacylglycerol O-acyltransferase 1 [Kappamyces sp. JEL0829]|nr:diacylglycerol O-acyltransferase 1 [Kappamyces sp. JEL0829]KAJ3355673.1 diacylglycerol O-acyltransferase 1 [Kappamyces sp. JEL0680]